MRRQEELRRMEELHSQEMEKRKEMQLRQEEDVRHREMEEPMRRQWEESYSRMGYMDPRERDMRMGGGGTMNMGGKSETLVTASTAQQQHSVRITTVFVS